MKVIAAFLGQMENHMTRSGKMDAFLAFSKGGNGRDSFFFSPINNLVKQERNFNQEKNYKYRQ